MSAAERTRTTFADYAALPESSQIIELIDGEIIVTSTLDEHSELFTRLFLLLGLFRQSGTLRAAPSGLYINEINVFEPDIFWISQQNERCALRSDRRYWQGAPDLVVEIVSPSTAYRDRGVKFRAYESIGVREYWLADPAGQFIEVYALEEGAFSRVGVFGAGETFASAALGADIDVTPLFS